MSSELNAVYATLATQTRAARAALSLASEAIVEKHFATSKDADLAAKAAKELMQLCVELGRWGGPVASTLSPFVQDAAVWAATKSGDITRMKSLNLSYGAGWSGTYDRGLNQLDVMAVALDSFAAVGAASPAPVGNPAAVASELAAILVELRALDAELEKGGTVSSADEQRASTLARRLVVFLGQAAALNNPSVEALVNEDFVDAALTVGKAAGDIGRMQKNGKTYGTGWGTHFDILITKLEMIARLSLPSVR